MRGAFVERFVRRFVGALVGAALALAAGCKSSFNGPYTCATGYDSCVNPSQSACETDTTTDGLNCNGCGMVCAVGAPCLASSCGPAAVRIAQAGAQTLVRTNTSAVLWSASNAGSTIFSLPLSAAAGATGTAIVTDGANLGNGRTSFAVDDTNVYYLAALPGGTSGCLSGGCIDLVQVSLANGARTILVPWSGLSALLTNAGIPVGNGAGGNPSASLAVNGSNVYFFLSLQSNNTTSYAIGDAMIGGAGQGGQVLGKGNRTTGPPGSGDLVANGTVVAFATWENDGSASVHAIRVTGGQMITLGSGGGTFGGIGPLAADASSIYTASSGCPCNVDGRQYNGSPPGFVTRFPVDGSAPQNIASFWGVTGGIAVDSTSVYWSTDTAAWKVPLAGGTPTPVAGNLSNGVAAYQCSNSCGGGSQPEQTTIAIAPSALYVAAGGTTQAILKVAR